MWVGRVCGQRRTAGPGIMRPLFCLLAAAQGGCRAASASLDAAALHPGQPAGCPAGPRKFFSSWRPRWMAPLVAPSAEDQAVAEAVRDKLKARRPGPIEGTCRRRQSPPVAFCAHRLRPPPSCLQAAIQTQQNYRSILAFTAFMAAYLATLWLQVGGPFGGQAGWGGHRPRRERAGAQSRWARPLCNQSLPPALPVCSCRPPPTAPRRWWARCARCCCQARWGGTHAAPAAGRHAYPPGGSCCWLQSLPQPHPPHCPLHRQPPTDSRSHTLPPPRRRRHLGALCVCGRGARLGGGAAGGAGVAGPRVWGRRVPGPLGVPRLGPLWLQARRGGGLWGRRIGPRDTNCCTGRWEGKACACAPGCPDCAAWPAAQGGLRGGGQHHPHPGAGAPVALYSFVCCATISRRVAARGGAQSTAPRGSHRPPPCRCAATLGGTRCWARAC